MWLPLPIHLWKLLIQEVPPVLQHENAKALCPLLLEQHVIRAPFFQNLHGEFFQQQTTYISDNVSGTKGKAWTLLYRNGAKHTLNLSVPCDFNHCKCIVTPPYSITLVKWGQMESGFVTKHYIWYKNFFKKLNNVTAYYVVKFFVLGC
jgi:hypothetical protein